MMNRRLIIRPEAETEMTDAFDWYENRTPGLGFDFLLCLDAIFNTIRRTPALFPKVHKNIRRALTRRFPYEIFYLTDADCITVLAVFHARRNPKQWQKRI